MFMADAAFALELLALVAGTYLLITACKDGVPCKAFVKFISYFVIVASILVMLCTSFYTVSYWMHGDFHPMGMGHMRSCPHYQWQSNQGMMPGAQSDKDGRQY